MSELQLVLVIMGSLFALVQLLYIGVGIAWASTGRSVRVGFVWGLLAAAFFIAAVLV